MDFETCLDVVNGLEAIKRYSLRGSPEAEVVARLMYKYQILEPVHLDTIVESLSAAFSKAKEAIIEITPAGLLQADIITQEISPWVKELRRKWFMKEEAPFSGYEEALDWLESQNPSMSSESRKMRQRLFGKAEEPPFSTEDEGVKWLKAQDPALVRELMREAYGNWMEEPFNEDEYEGARDWLVGRRLAIREPFPFAMLTVDRQQAVMICPERESPAEDLILWCHKWADWLGLRETNVIMHVLANSKLIIARFEIQAIHKGGVQLPSGRFFERVEAHITIRGGITLDQMRAIYARVRDELGIKRAKEISARHLALHQIVKKKGGPVSGPGSVAFWKSVNDEWGGEYKDWRGVKIAYTRLMERRGMDSAGPDYKTRAPKRKKGERSHGEN